VRVSARAMSLPGYGQLPGLRRQSSVVELLAAS
jgi:hypothetical protein